MMQLKKETVKKRRADKEEGKGPGGCGKVAMKRGWGGGEGEKELEICMQQQKGRPGEKSRKTQMRGRERNIGMGGRGWKEQLRKTDSFWGSPGPEEAGRGAAPEKGTCLTFYFTSDHSWGVRGLVLKKNPKQKKNKNKTKSGEQKRGKSWGQKKGIGMVSKEGRKKI